MKPSQMPACTGTLPSRAASAKPVASDLGRGLRRRHDLQQLHDVGRAEEVEADEALGVRQALGDRARVEVGGVGGEDRVRAAGAAEAVEDRALDGELLEHRLDHQIGVGQAA